MQIICMEKGFVKILKLNIWVKIMICILEVIHYFWLMFLENKFKIYKLDPAKFLSDSGLE